MKKITLFTLILGFLPILAFAKDKMVLDVTLPPGFETQICPRKFWQGVSVAWQGVQDRRPDPSISIFQNKTKVPQTFTTSRPLTDYFDEALRKVLSECGMKIVTKSEKHRYSIQAEIQEFHVSRQKDSLKESDSDAESSLALIFDSDFSNADVKITYSMESGNNGLFNKKKIAKTIANLIVGTMQEMIESHQLSFVE